MSILLEKIIEKQVLNSINSVVEQFQENSYNYLYESDIQSALFAEMRKNITEGICIPGSKNQNMTYKLGLVYTEYFKKIDLVCLNPNSNNYSELKTHKGFDTYVYNLPILVAIELKYGVMGSPRSYVDCQNDFIKLSKLKDSKPKIKKFYNKLSHNKLQKNP